MFKKWIYKQVNSNYWIVTDEENIDYFVFKRDRAWAFSWDLVKIKIFKEAIFWKKAEAEIINIISRTRNDLVWIFIKTKNKPFWFVRIYNTFFWKDVFIDEKNINNAKNNDIVIVYITSWTEKPFWIIKSVLWNKDTAWIDELIVLYENNVRMEFPEEVNKETLNLKVFSNQNSRIDLTKELIVTIDWADAKDLDDAIWVRLLENWNYELWVHIADVTHYIVEKSTLDREALKRWTSIYLPEKVIPMLPERLSNNLCSLNPDEEKATLSITMEIDANNWKVLSRKIFESFIKSKARLTYDQVAKIVGNDGTMQSFLTGNVENIELTQMLKLAYDLKKIIYARRRKEWKIEFEFWEVKLEIWDKWEVKNVYKLERNEAHRIIEEFMIIANEEISKFFWEKKIPFLYRIHEKPGEDSIFTLKNVLESHWIVFDQKNINPLIISNIIDNLKWSPNSYFLSKQVLQAMAKAKYMDEALWHFWLSLKYYSHFTSPIRRYPDLQIHRIIKEYLNWKLSQEKIIKYKKDLKTIAKICSENEQKAENIENKIKFLKIIEFMQDKIWQQFDWIISWISPVWMYVELESWVEWMVHQKNFTSNMFFDEENKCFLDEVSKEKYSMWKKVKIEVLKADKKMWFLDFILVQR